MDILRIITVANFRHDRIGETVEETMILCAILIGQAEGRLMCASDIASHIGMPRASVHRKLSSIRRSRSIGVSKQGSRVCYFLADVNEATMLDGLKQLTHIRQRGDKYAGWSWLPE